MLVALKLYLFVLEPGKECDVLVYRTIDEAYARWVAVARASPDASALLHVGCLRPRLEDVGVLLKERPGRVLLSEAARWAIPRDLAVGSVRVRLCKYAGGLDDIAVYLAVHGWGYEVRPSQVPAPAADAITAPARERRAPVGWIAELASVAPELGDALASAGVATDSEYVGWRDSADVTLRRRCDRARFKMLVAPLGKAEREEPTILTGILPLDILSMPVEALLVPTRVVNFFRSHRIRTVRELGRWRRGELQDVKNLGRKSIADIAAALTSAADVQRVGESSQETELALSSTGSLSERLERGMRFVKQRAEGVLRKRIAYEAPFCTFEQIGVELGVSRERARQLEQKGLKTLQTVSFRDHALARELRRLIGGAREPVYLDLVCATDPWFAGVSELTVEHLVEAMCDEEFHVIHVDGRTVVTRIGQADWERLKQSVLSYLGENLGASREDVDVHVLSSAHALSVPELRSLLSTYLKPRLHFGIRPDGRETLTGVGTEGRNSVATVLLEASGPLHATEIARRVEQIRGETVSLGVVRRWLSELEACLFGRGTYGTVAHIPGVVKQDEIVECVDDLLRGEEAQRQWHVWEVFDELVSERPEICDGLDPYILNILMRRLPKEWYEYQGRFVWTFKGRGLDDTQRIDIADACVAALLEAGRPLTTEEMKAVVARSRGLHPGLMAYHNDRLMRIAPGIWGLKERDTGLSEAEQREVLDRAHAVLVSRGRELHVSEVSGAVVSDLSDARVGYVICSLAQGDARFHWSRGQLLGLRVWGATRRVSVSQAVRDVVAGLGSATSFEEIWSRVCRQVDRPVPRFQVSSQLQVSQLHFDEATSMWGPRDKVAGAGDVDVAENESGGAGVQTAD